MTTSGSGGVSGATTRPCVEIVSPKHDPSGTATRQHPNGQQVTKRLRPVVQQPSTNSLAEFGCWYMPIKPDPSGIAAVLVSPSWQSHVSVVSACVWLRGPDLYPTGGVQNGFQRCGFMWFFSR